MGVVSHNEWGLEASCWSSYGHVILLASYWLSDGHVDDRWRAPDRGFCNMAVCSLTTGKEADSQCPGLNPYCQNIEVFLPQAHSGNVP